MLLQARGAIKVSWLETPRNDFFAAEQATAQNRQIRPPMVDNAVTVSGLPSASGTVSAQRSATCEIVLPLHDHPLTPVPAMPQLLQVVPVQTRRLLASATAIATSTGGQSTADARSAGRNAVSSANANSAGNGTALSVGVANGTAVVNSSATATGEHAYMPFGPDLPGCWRRHALSHQKAQMMSPRAGSTTDSPAETAAVTAFSSWHAICTDIG